MAALAAWDAIRDAVRKDWPTCKGELRPWIYKVARNRILDEARRRDVRARHEAKAGDAVHVAGAPSTGVGTHELRGRVRDLVGELPERERTMIWLSYDDELRSADIAGILGTSKTGERMTAENVRQELATLRASIRNALERDGLVEVARDHLRERLHR